MTTTQKYNDMNTSIKPLVVTPSPFVSESLKGFILRTSQLNGYHSPSDMLSGSGMTRQEMNSIIPPLEKLAPLLNRTLEDMKKIGYYRPWEKRYQKTLTIFKHQLPSYYVSIKNPKICTQCIIEKGFIEGYWDLKHAVACPIHMTSALSACPECKKKLSWFRPKLLECECGCDFSNHPGKPINNREITGLLSLFRCKFLGLALDKNLLKEHLGFPVEHLDAMKMYELLSIIERLENRCKFNRLKLTPQDHVPSKEAVLENAAIALSHWPKGLYEYLNSFNKERVSIQGFGLRKQFESFYGSLFKSDIPKAKIAFIKDAFIRFGADEWKQAYVTSKLDRGSGLGKQIVGIYGLAKALGVMPITARTMVKKDLIQGKKGNVNGRTRHFFDLDQELPFSANNGATLTVRKAALWLGLPVSVLQVLREQKHYEGRHIARPFSAYHKQDLIIFRDKLFGCCPEVSVILVESHITLRQVMRMKVGANGIKASFINNILKGKLIPLGKTGNELSDMVFSKVRVKEFMLESKVKLKGDTYV